MASDSLAEFFMDALRTLKYPVIQMLLSSLFTGNTRDKELIFNRRKRINNFIQEEKSRIIKGPASCQEYSPFPLHSKTLP